MIRVAASILACDFSSLGEECEKVVKAGAEFIHFDVMDGHFVPNISLGAQVLSSLYRHNSAKYDVHLMIKEPMKYADMFIDAGAYILTFHQETDTDIAALIAKIKKRGVKAGLAISPMTPVENLYKYIEDIDLALIMTVEPGFGGQAFIPETAGKIAALKQKAEQLGLYNLLIEVDGGINRNTAGTAIENGANLLVAGSSIFNSDVYKKAIDELRNAH